MEKSDEKLDSMTVLMLHYCAGLQHCLDQEEVERVKQLEEEKRSGDDQDATEDGALESMNTERLDDVDVDCTASVEDATGHDGESNAVTTLDDGAGQTEVDEEELVMTITERELGSDVEELTVQDVMLASSSEVVLAVTKTTVAHETGDDSRTEACVEAETEAATETYTSNTQIETATETYTSNTPTFSSTEQSVDRGEAKELSVGATLSVDTCRNGTANLDSVTCRDDDAT